MRSASNFLDERLPDRFWDKVQPCPMSGCWLWTGSADRLGYGRIRAAGRIVTAHRFAFHALCDEVPSEREIDHLCRVRCCVNPGHMEIVTRAINVRRSGSGLATQNTFRSMKRCRRNLHELSDRNRKWWANGTRWICLDCEAERKNA